MKQIKENALAISVVCPTDIDLGDPVLIADDLEVEAIDTAACERLIGNVVAHEEGEATCTISTRFRERRDDRVADPSDAPPIGPFVFSAAGKVIQFSPAIIVSVTGTEEETYDIGSGTSDAMKIKIGTGSSQNFTLTAGGTRTAAQVAADINATATDFAADGATGYVILTCDEIGDDLEIEAVSNNAYTELGFTVAVNNGDASHDPGNIAGMLIKKPALCSITTRNKHPFAIVDGVSDAFKIKVGSGSSQVVDLTAGATQTASDIATDINNNTSDLTATALPGGAVKITADDPYVDLEIETVANNAYTVLGLDIAVTTAPATVETLEY